MINTNDFINWTRSSLENNPEMKDFRTADRMTKQLELSEAVPLIPVLTAAGRTLIASPTAKRVAKDTALTAGIKLAKKKLTKKKEELGPSMDGEQVYENDDIEEAKIKGRGFYKTIEYGPGEIKPIPMPGPKPKPKPKPWESSKPKPKPWELKGKNKLKNRDRSTIRYDHIEHDGEEMNEIGAVVGSALAGGAIAGGAYLAKKGLKRQRRGQDARATASHDMYGGEQDRPFNFGDRRREKKGTRVSLSKGGGSTDPEKPGGYQTKDQDKLSKIASVMSEYDPQGTELAEGIIGGLVKGGLALGAGYAAYKGAGSMINKWKSKSAGAQSDQEGQTPGTPVSSVAGAAVGKLKNMAVQRGMDKVTDRLGGAAKSAGKAIAKSSTVKGIAGDLMGGGRKLATSGKGGKIGGWAAKAMGAAGGALKKAGKSESTQKSSGGRSRIVVTKTPWSAKSSSDRVGPTGKGMKKSHIDLIRSRRTDKQRAAAATNANKQSGVSVDPKEYKRMKPGANIGKVDLAAK